MAHARRLYAHRGARLDAPENTLPAFARALEDGANALELDVHVTSDGEVVVAHDRTGLRMAGVRRAIRLASWAEVRAWDVGLRFVDRAGGRPFAGRGVRVPLLAEVLAAFPGVPVNADLKQWIDPGPAAARVIAAIRRAGAAERVLLTSLRTHVVRAIRRLRYEGETGLALGEAVRVIAGGAIPAGAHAAQFLRRLGPFDVASRGLVERCHAAGLRVDFFTVNDPAEAEALLALGADGIMTDDPARLAPVVLGGRLSAARV